MILVRSTHRPAQIGDSLAQVPFIDWLCRRFDQPAMITGFNAQVIDLLVDYHPFFFSDQVVDGFSTEVKLDVAAMLDGYSDMAHMCQSYFAANGFDPPDLPVDFAMTTKTWAGPDVMVLAPYSWSDLNGNKLWPHERWIEVVHTLRKRHGASQTYVLGSKSRDDPEVYLRAGLTPLFDRPLPQVLDLIQNAILLLSVDNGISHLAHYGGVSRHVLLAPGCHAGNWACNPRGLMVRAANPIDVSVKDVLQAAETVLGSCGI